MNSSISTKNLIKSLDFFSSLNDEQFELLGSISTVNNYTKDYIIHYEKEQSQYIFFLLDGLAKAYKINKNGNEIFLFYIYENSIISDFSNQIDGKLGSFANVVLLENSKIFSIDYKKFKENFIDKGILCLELSNQIILKSQQLQLIVNREFILNSVAKVAMLLHNDLEMFNRLKRAEVSTMLHIQPETLSRVLGRLKRDNIIDSQVGKITLLDAKALRDIYEE